MPVRRYFIVRQEREVKVSAATVLEAAQYAEYAFKGEIMEGDQSVKPNILTEVKERSLDIREDY